METFPPTNPFHHHLPQAMFQQYDLHAPSFASGPRHSAIDHHGSSSGQPSTSATTPALFSPSLFAPSPLTPSGGPLGGSYFSALGDSMGVSFGLLQQQQQQHNSAFAAAQANAFFVAQQQQQQYQLERLLSSPASRFEVLDDGAVDGRPQQQQQPAPAAFWSTSPPPPQRTASLHEFETASAADGGTGGRASTASSSSYSVSTPAVSDDDDGAYAFADVRAVDDAERGHLPGLDVPGAAGAQPARDDRAGSEHSDAALRSADGKGTTIAEVLEEMGITRKSYDRMTPAKKRQIRNKVSARAFRARKKSLVENLEATIADKDLLIENLRKQVGRLQAQNAKLERSSARSH